MGSFVVLEKYDPQGVVLPQFDADGTHNPTDEKHAAWDGPVLGRGCVN